MPRRSSRSARFRPAVEALEPREVPALVLWDGGGGDFMWSNPLNWSGDRLPGAADDAIIDVPASDAVVEITSTAAARTVSSREPLRARAATLTVDRLDAPALSLVDGAVLTSTQDVPTDPTTMHPLRIDVSGRLVIDAASRIDVSGLGFAGDAGPGAGVNGWDTRGATHAGIGRLGVTSYGSFAAPVDYGSGGGRGNHTGGSGGGAVRVRAGALTLDGAIRADAPYVGGTLNGGSGGGAGGSAWVETDVFTGSGVISADGATSFIDQGGGGGRVAVHADTTGFTGSLRAAGGNGAGPGTVFTRAPGAAGGLLRIDGPGATELGGRVEVAGLTVSGGARVRTPVGVGLEVVATGDVVVAAGSSLGADGRGFASEQGLSPGRMTRTTNAYGGTVVTLSGASHGGTGVDSPQAAAGTAPPNATYGSFTAPVAFGSGGPRWYDYNTRTERPGGAGGGAIRVTAGRVVIDGILSADGDPGSTGFNTIGGGAGGSVLVVADRLEGVGRVAAVGGHLAGGGRVSVRADAAGFRGTVTALGGAGGRTGTVYLHTPGETLGTLVYDETGRPGAAPVIEVGGPLALEASLSLRGGAQLAPAPGRRLELTVRGDLTIDNQSVLTADSRGHPAGFGPGAGRVVSFGSYGPTYAGGGGYGGAGGRPAATGGLTGLGGEPYGSAAQPTDFGSGGATGGGAADAGGGAIRVTARQVVVDGRITANAGTGSGAGGSVWVRAERVGGTGTISADGGAGFARYGDGVGGGGGRVAIESVDPPTLSLARVTTAGGSGSGMPGQPGTVVWGRLAESPVEPPAAPADLTAVGVTSSGGVFAGEPVTVTWTTRNVGGAAVTVPWADAVYLSTDDRWDAADVLLGTADQTAGLAAGAGRSTSLEVRLPARLPAGYHLLVRADASGRVAEGSEANNVAAAAVALDVRPLVSGTPVDGTLAAGEMRLFRVDVPAGVGRVVALTAAAGSAVELYARRDALPTRRENDHAAAGAFADHQHLVIPAGAGGTYYVAVVAATVPAGGAAFTVAASEAGSLAVFDAGYGRAGAGGERTIKITGTGFDRTTTVRLTGGPAAVRYERTDAGTLYATFDLRGTSAGRYDVVVENASGASAAVTAGLEVTAAAAGGLTLRVAAPAEFRRARVSAVVPVVLTWANDTPNDIAAPVLSFASSEPFAATRAAALAGEGTGWSLFLPLDAMAGGVVRPGQSGSITVYVTIAPRDPAGVLRDLSYSFTVMFEDDAAAFDWDVPLSRLDTRYLGGEAAATVEAFRATLGGTAGDYRRLLADGVRRAGELLSDRLDHVSAVAAQAAFDRFSATRGTSLVGVLRPAGTGLDLESAALTVAVRHRTTGAVTTAAVGRDGGFTFPRLASGEYDATITGAVPADGTVLAFDLVAGEHRVLDVEVAVGRTVSAVVTDAAGNPLAGANVRLTQPGKLFASVAVTDGTGRLTARALAAVVYTLTVSRAGFVRFTHAVDASAGDVDLGLLALASAGVVSGRVVAPDGAAVSDARVVATRDTDGAVAETWTGATGTYRLDELGEGTWSIAVEHPEYRPGAAGPFAVTAGGTAGADITLAAGSGLTGRVVDAGGQPVVGAFVQLTDTYGQSYTNRTDAEGRFFLAGLPDGVPLELRILAQHFQVVTVAIDALSQFETRELAALNLLVMPAAIELPPPPPVGPFTSPTEPPPLPEPTSEEVRRIYDRINAVLRKLPRPVDEDEQFNKLMTDVRNLVLSYRRAEIGRDGYDPLPTLPPAPKCWASDELQDLYEHVLQLREHAEEYINTFPPHDQNNLISASKAKFEHALQEFESIVDEFKSTLALIKAGAGVLLGLLNPASDVAYVVVYFGSQYLAWDGFAEAASAKLSNSLKSGRVAVAAMTKAVESLRRASSGIDNRQEDFNDGILGDLKQAIREYEELRAGDTAFPHPVFVARGPVGREQRGDPLADIRHLLRSDGVARYGDFKTVSQQGPAKFSILDDGRISVRSDVSGPSFFYYSLSVFCKDGSSIRVYATFVYNADYSAEVQSGDPNDMFGPAGVGPGNHVTPGLMPYTVRFENDPELANAPAQFVTVTHTLDPDLDPASFRLANFGFGDTVVAVPADRTHFETRVDLRAARGMFVDVVADFDPATRTVTWTFQAVDSATGEPLDPTSPAGFLPPNGDRGEGEGFVRFTVRPLAGRGTGTRIDAQARIVFDANDPIDTPAVFHTLDAGGPTSRVLHLPAQVAASEFLVRWQGADDEGGVGVRAYTVQVSEDGGPFRVWLAETAATEASYSGQIGRRYAFFVIARDALGYAEPAKAIAEAVTVVAQPTGEIRGTVFDDADGDGVRGEGENGLAGVTVFLDADGNGTRDADERTAVTGGAGGYMFDGVEPGAYAVRFEPPAGRVPSAGATGVAVTVTGGAAATADFGATTPGATAPAVRQFVVQDGLSSRANVDRVAWQFTEDVPAAVLVTGGQITTAVRLLNLTTGAEVPLAAAQFRYDAFTRTLMWALNAYTGRPVTLPDGVYEWRLGRAAFADATGNPLAAGVGSPTGDAVAFRAHRLAGDVTGDGETDAADGAAVAQAIGARPDQPKWDANLDVDRDGLITARDRLAVAKAQGGAVSAPASPAAGSPSSLRAGALTDLTPVRLVVPALGTLRVLLYPPVLNSPASPASPAELVVRLDGKEVPVRPALTTDGRTVVEMPVAAGQVVTVRVRGTPGVAYGFDTLLAPDALTL